MKKSIVCGGLIIGNLAAAAFKTIDQRAIDKACTVCAQELKIARAKKNAVTALGVAALCTGVYGSYAMWEKTSKHIQTLAKHAHADSADASGSWWTRLRTWCGKQAGAAVDFGPVLVIASLTSSALSAGMDHITRQMFAYYRPFNWQWMMRERAPLVPLVHELKQCAAALDPSSELFSLLNQVTIHWEGPCSVMTAEGWIQVSAFDELVALRMRAQPINDQTRAVYVAHCERTWNALVDRMVQCLGFIAHKQRVGGACEFDVRQLATISEHVITSTNLLANQLPAILAVHNQSQSSGLLAAVYRYSTDVLHCCEMLTTNTLVAG